MKKSKVEFNNDIGPGMSGIKKAGVKRPNLERGAASRGKKRSAGKRK